MTIINLYERMGGKDGVRHLVDVFYDYMESLPEADTIRKLHSEDLTEARTKLFEFLSGWSGGPNLYIEKHGHPRLRKRHMPFAIGEAERDQWLLCMQKALDDCIEHTEVRNSLFEKFSNIADFMRNQ